jgi:hypothetical protein
MSQAASGRVRIAIDSAGRHAMEVGCVQTHGTANNRSHDKSGDHLRGVSDGRHGRQAKGPSAERRTLRVCDVRSPSARMSAVA